VWGTSGKAHEQVVPEQEFNFVCGYTRVFYDAPCTGLPAPFITYLPLPPGVAGRHFEGTDFIILHYKDIYETAPWEQVIVHETVHYVLFANGILDICVGEEAARRATATYFGLDYNDDWRKNYPGCER
jgi:hypothetical protein